jgi:acetyl esterase/lipase
MRRVVHIGLGVSIVVLAAISLSVADESSMVSTRGIAYGSGSGSNETNLDVYASPDAHERPVVVYVHGGGWAAGDKANVDLKPGFFVENGYVFVSVNYRLTPDVGFPTHVEDVAVAIRWVHDHIVDYGGDPSQIDLMGHSAGAHLVALIGTDPRYLKAVGLGLWAIHAVVPLDTQAYDLAALAAESGGSLPSLYAATFTQKPAAWADASPIAHVTYGTNVPPMIVAVSRGVGESPNRHRVEQSQSFVAALREAGVEAEIVVSLGQSHNDINRQFGEPGDRVSNRVLAFLQSVERHSVVVLRDLEYARVDDLSLKLDLYLPDPLPDKRLPLVIWIHGGGWRGGSKDRTRAPETLGTGYAVASIDYRLSHEAVFPAQIHDCKAAIRWLRGHATEYNLDPDRFGAWGSSAGGHLVALLGTSGGVGELEGIVGDHLRQSSDVQAVCDYYGPTDLLAMLSQPSLLDHHSPTSPESLLLGGPVSENQELAWLASPIAFVDPTDPPFFIVHGDQDPTVPVEQSIDFHAALTDLGVDSMLRIVEGAKHGGFPDEVYEAVKAFFDDHLR